MDKEILSRDRPGRESSPVTSPQGKTGNPKGEGRSPLGNKLNTEGKAKAAAGAKLRSETSAQKAAGEKMRFDKAVFEPEGDVPVKGLRPKQQKRYARKKSEKAAEKAKPKPSATLKVDVSKLPNPPLPATKEVRIGEVVTDAEISSLIEHFSYDPSSSRKNVYTEDEDATIIRMAEEGATYSMIANKIGGTPNAIRIQHEKLISAGIGKAQ